MSLPQNLIGVVLPEICRVQDLVDHTGIPADVWESELEWGRLRGRLVPECGWLIHKDSVRQWAGVPTAVDEVLEKEKP